MIRVRLFCVRGFQSPVQALGVRPRRARHSESGNTARRMRTATGAQARARIYVYVYIHVHGEVRARERICSVKESLRYNHWLLNVGSKKLLLELHNHQGQGFCTFKCFSLSHGKLAKITIIMSPAFTTISHLQTSSQLTSSNLATYS